MISEPICTGDDTEFLLAAARGQRRIVFLSVLRLCHPC